ncbi:hypothetical protein D9M69_649970 [compost metagenome]
MVATSGQENRLVAIGLHGVKAQLLMPEGFSILRIAHAQVNVTDDSILRCTVPFATFTVNNVEKVFNVERFGPHIYTIAIPLPRVMRAVGIDLNAIAFRVSQINSFTDIVIRRPGNR